MKNILHIPFNQNRIYGLDILRALAILFVVLSHSRDILPKPFAGYVKYFVLEGVVIFFVLSGYLIGTILIKTLEKNGTGFKNLMNFWVRRWFRTLPNYYLMLFLLIILNYIYTDGFSIHGFKKYFVFCQNLYFGHSWLFPESWSLTVEEWFYLLIPIFLVVSIRWFKLSVKQSVLLIAITILILVMAFRVYRYHTVTLTSVAEFGLIFRKQVVMRLDNLMYGVIGAYLAYYYKEFWLKFKKPLLYLGIFIFVFLKFFKQIFDIDIRMYMSIFSFPLNSFATLLLLPYLSTYEKGSGFLYKSLTYISLISYSMYIFHLSLIKVWILDNINFENIFYWGKSLAIIIEYILYWGLTILLSILNYKYFELPTTALRNRFSK